MRGSRCQGRIAVWADPYEFAVEPNRSRGAAKVGGIGRRDFDFGAPSGGGFLVFGQPLYVMSCREGAMASVSSRTSDDATYLNVQVTPDRSAFPCNTAQGDQQGTNARTGSGSNLFNLNTTLELPESASAMDPRLALAPFPTAFPGDSRVMSSQVELETDMSLRALVEHFGQQLEEQGWSYDSGWSGEYSSGSGWARSPPAEMNWWGFVVALGNSDYRTTFRASTRQSQ